MHDAERLVPMCFLTSVYGSFAARVLVARLEDEGIGAQLGGPVDSPYRFTVGAFAQVDVYVPADQVDDAAYVLLANAVDDATELPEPRRARLRWPAVALLVAIVVTVVSPVVRYVGL